MSDTITEIVLIVCGITFSYVLMKSIATNNIGRWVGGIILALILIVLGEMGVAFIMLGVLSKYVAFAALAVSYGLTDKVLGPKIGGMNIMQEIACSISFSTAVCGILGMFLV